ncbi:MAG: hypothetical protein AB1847_11290 [bacterium]
MQKEKKHVVTALVITLSLCFLGIFSGCATSGRTDLAGESNAVSTNPEGRTYYTKVNIWYEDPSRIFSTNYHKGNIIPVGTQVKIRSFRMDQIQFTDESEATVYTLIYMSKYSQVTMKELFDQYFSEGNVMAEGGEFTKFTKEEQDNIKMGTIAEGMCREAVLMAYGYPPKHRTPSLSNNMWTYWNNRFDTVVITFQDDRVQNIKN